MSRAVLGRVDEPRNRRKLVQERRRANRHESRCGCEKCRIRREARLKGAPERRG